MLEILGIYMLLALMGAVGVLTLTFAMFIVCVILICVYGVLEAIVAVLQNKTKGFAK